MRPMVDRVIASGLIGAVEEIQVQPLIEGQPIQTLLVDVGDRVEAGQVMATLSKTTLELQRTQAVASLAAARATIAQAEAQLIDAESNAAEAARVSERTNTLRKQGSASQAAADTATSNAVSATARVTVARQSLEAARTLPRTMFSAIPVVAFSRAAAGSRDPTARNTRTLTAIDMPIPNDVVKNSTAPA